MALSRGNTALSSEDSFDVPIFSPLNDIPESEGSQVHAPAHATLSPPAHSAPQGAKKTLTSALFGQDNGSGDKDDLAKPLDFSLADVSAAHLMNTGTPNAGRSVRVKISARRLREIESPYASDRSLPASQSGHGSMLAAQQASPGEPAPPPGPLPAPPPQSGEPLPAPPPQPGGPLPAPPPQPGGPLQPPAPPPSRTPPAAREPSPAPPPKAASGVRKGSRQYKPGSEFKDPRHSVKPHQRKGRALKQGLLLDVNSTTKALSTSDASIIVSPELQLDSKDSKMQLLKECSSSSLAGQRRRGGATAEQQVPHLVHLITSNKPTARSGDAKEPKEPLDTQAGTKDLLPAGVQISDKAPLSLGRNDPAAPTNQAGQEKRPQVQCLTNQNTRHTDHQPSGGVRCSHCLDMQSAADLIKMRQGRGRVKGEEEGVRETEDLTERTARLVATCTAAATAAVLTSSLKQRQASSSLAPQHVKTSPPQHSPPPRTRPSGRRRHARLDHTQQPDLYPAHRSEDGPARGCADDARRSLAGEVRLQDMLRRLQMLEELEHSKLLRLPQQNVDPPNADTAAQQPSSRLQAGRDNSCPFSTNTAHYAPNGGSVDCTGGELHSSRHLPVAADSSQGCPAYSQEPCSLVRNRGLRPGSPQQVSGVGLSSGEASRATGSGEQWMSTGEDRIAGSGEAKKSEAGYPLSKACGEELSHIENVLQQVRLSQKEAEFQCSVAEMEEEDGRMGRILQLLTDCPDEANAGKISMAISRYLSAPHDSPDDKPRPPTPPDAKKHKKVLCSWNRDKPGTKGRSLLDKGRHGDGYFSPKPVAAPERKGTYKLPHSVNLKAPPRHLSDPADSKRSGVGLGTHLPQPPQVAPHVAAATGRRDVASSGSAVAIPLKPPSIRPSPLLYYSPPKATAPPALPTTRVDVALQTSLTTSPVGGKDKEDSLPTTPLLEEPTQTSLRIEGKQTPSPAHTTPHPATPPPHTPVRPEPEQEGTSSEELDQTIRNHLQTRAVEWVQRELMARLLSQVDRSPQRSSHTSIPRPPLSPPALAPLTSGGEGSQWDQMLGSEGLQVFVSAGRDVDEGVVEGEVRAVVREEMSLLIRTWAGKEGCDVSHSNSISSEDYTPVEPSISTTLSTPVSTPVASRHDHTPTQPEQEHTAEEPSYPDVTTPIATPTKVAETVITEDDTLSTPQPTDTSSSTHIPTDLSTQSEATPTLSTPSATPLPAYPSSATISTPKPSRQPSPSDTPTKPPQQEFSLSTSSSSDSTSTPAPPTASATPSSTTDPPISMGEFVLKRRQPVPWPLANSSLSEGEVPLSPGDARWYALYATKMATAPASGEDQDTTVQAFLELKNSPDPSSDSSHLSDSHLNVYSAGEVRRPTGTRAVQHNRDLFPLPRNTEDLSSDNTLSDMPSLRCDEPFPHTSSPLRRPHIKYPRSKHRKSAMKGQRSPGEVSRRALSVNFGPSFVPAAGEDTTLSQSRSEGEVPAIISREQRKWIKVLNEEGASGRRGQGSTDSPRADRTGRNETRNGIDVINISKSTPPSSSSATPTPENSHPLGPRLIQVAASPPEVVSSPHRTRRMGVDHRTIATPVAPAPLNPGSVPSPPKLHHLPPGLHTSPPGLHSPPELHTSETPDSPPSSEISGANKLSHDLAVADLSSLTPSSNSITGLQHGDTTGTHADPLKVATPSIGGGHLLEVRIPGTMADPEGEDEESLTYTLSLSDGGLP